MADFKSCFCFSFSHPLLSRALSNQTNRLCQPVRAARHPERHPVSQSVKTKDVARTFPQRFIPVRSLQVSGCTFETCISLIRRHRRRTSLISWKLPLFKSKNFMNSRKSGEVCRRHTMPSGHIFIPLRTHFTRNSAGWVVVAAIENQSNIQPDQIFRCL